jgi:hypothetical protein
MRLLYKHLIESEYYSHNNNNNNNNEYQDSSVVSLGKVNNYELLLLLAETGDEFYKQVTSVVKYTDGETAIRVCMKDMELFFTKPKIFMAILAHELGHIDSGHFDDGDFKTDIIVDYSPIPLERITPEQAVKHVIRGYVLSKELQADIKAMEYVPVSDIIEMQLHSIKHDRHCCSTVVLLDKLNRVSIYLDIDKSNPTIASKEIKLSLINDKIELLNKILGQKPQGS